MKRRRYLPSAEGLEERKLLAASLLTAKNPFGSLVDPTPVLPDTLEQKADRIDHLPFFMEQLQPGRVIPASTMTNIQNDLRALVTRLGQPGSYLLNKFNVQLRNTLPHASLTQADAAGLNNLFGQVLAASKLDPQQVANFQTDMRSLGQVDANSINPNLLAANDYSLVLQVAIAVGQPLPRPTAPSLAPADTGTKNAHVTAVHQPSLVGSYSAGATLQILDSNGNVLGSGVVGKNGQYSIQVSQRLTDGVYVLGVRAFDNGIVSELSPTVRIRIVTPKHK
jgi:hypothetical protein